jgi:hypothetical protein
VTARKRKEEIEIMANEELVPTSEEVEMARDTYAVAFHKDAEDDDPMMLGRAQIYALRRQYPAVYELTGKLKLDAPIGFGVIDVGLPNDPRHHHVVLEPEDFLEYALNGEIALNQDGYPDYTGTDRLRG